MPKRARYALQVNDLASSLAFYVNRLGFHLAEGRPDADIALVVAPDGDLLVLAGALATRHIRSKKRGRNNLTRPIITCLYGLPSSSGAVPLGMKRW